MTYTEFRDHYDDEGYRAYVASDDEPKLIEFANWCDAHGVTWTVASMEREDEDLAIVESIWTNWITDKPKAMLLRLTWGGSQ